MKAAADLLVILDKLRKERGGYLFTGPYGCELDHCIDELRKALKEAPEPKVDIGWLLKVYVNASTEELVKWADRLKREGHTPADLEEIDDLQRVIEERARG